MHLWGVESGVDPSPHFRPLHFAWNLLLLRAFGTEPAGWYTAGLAVHAVNALLAASVVQNAFGAGARAGRRVRFRGFLLLAPGVALDRGSSGGLLAVTGFGW